MGSAALVDVVVVSYNSRAHLRACVEQLAADPETNVIVVDNASGDGSLETIADIDVTRIARSTNIGFGGACNEGWRHGRAPLVLFLNPDARMEPADVRTLADVVEQDPDVGVVGPRILDFDGTLVYSQRRFLDLRSIWAQAVFLHHLASGSSWTDGIIRSKEQYARAGSPDWVSGACMLLRRSVLERLDGFDPGFFMYCEDQDLCRRGRNLGLDVRFEPRATAHHLGGASAPRGELFDVLVRSRRRYLGKHRSRPAAWAGSAGLAAGELLRVVVTRGGYPDRVGHVRGLLAAVALPGRRDPN